jgi:serine phosphatase RsbU (regulator of sigma subunit)/CHASE2 domain-containing sensor protein
VTGRTIRTTPAVLVGFSVVVVVLVLLTADSRPVRMADKLIDDNWYRLLRPQRSEDRIAVIEIDDRTLEHYFPEIPLPRGQIALLVDALLSAETGARSVTIDLYFEGPDKTDPANDTLLSYIISAHAGSTVCGLNVSDLTWNKGADSQIRSDELKRFSYHITDLAIPKALQVTMPPPLFLTSADYYGHIDVYKDETAVPRELPLFVNCGGSALGAVALETVCCYLNVPRSQVEVVGEHVRIDSLSVPVDEYGSFKLRHFINSPPYPSYSMIDVMDIITSGGDARGLFGDKIVLVGINSKTYYPKEFSYTPDGRERPNVYLHADVISNMLSGYFAHGVSRFTLLLLLIGVALTVVLISFLRDKRNRLLLSLVVVLAVLVLDVVLFKYGILFPAVPLLLTSLPLAVYTYFSSFREQEEIIKVQERETLELRKREASLVAIEKEIQVARAIQEHLLPKTMPDIPGFDIYGINLPARGVSGDLFDFMEIKPGYWAITIADVSGKGISASLLMTAAQSILRAEAQASADGVPKCTDIMRATNSLLHAITDPARFVTMFYSILDVENRRLQFVNAGHNPPIVIAPDQTANLLEAGDIILGMMPDFEFNAHSLVLSPGQKILLYTDGVVEASDEKADLYGESRLLSFVSENGRLSAKAFTERLLSDVTTFCGDAEQADDITVVVLGAKQ